MIWRRDGPRHHLAGAGHDHELVEEVIPTTFDIANAVVNVDGGEAISAPQAAFAQVRDFNPLENVVDVVIPPLNGDGLGNVF